MPKSKKTGVEPAEMVGSTTNKTNKSYTGLDITKKAIQKKYGKVMSYLGDHGDMQIPTISTGCLGLDIALGRGGMARGRIYEVFGPASGGKTTLAMSTIVQAQRRGMNCAFVDAEHAVDPALFKSMGANINDVLIIQGYSGEANLDISEMLMKSNGVDVLVVDSVSALIPQSEVEAGIEQDFMALLARLMSKALRRLVPIANETDTLLIFINQIRQNIGAWGNPETTSGGEALNFYSTGRISVRGGEYKKSRIVAPISGEVVGHNTKFEVVKNKLAPPFRSANVPLIYGFGYDVHWEILNLAITYEVIEKSGSWYNYGDKSLGQGELAMLGLLREDVEFYKEIRDKIIEITGLKEHYERNK